MAPLQPGLTNSAWWYSVPTVYQTPSEQTRSESPQPTGWSHSLSTGINGVSNSGLSVVTCGCTCKIGQEIIQCPEPGQVVARAAGELLGFLVYL